MKLCYEAFTSEYAHADVVKAQPKKITVAATQSILHLVHIPQPLTGTLRGSSDLLHVLLGFHQAIALGVDHWR